MKIINIIKSVNYTVVLKGDKCYKKNVGQGTWDLNCSGRKCKRASIKKSSEQRLEGGQGEASRYGRRGFQARYSLTLHSYLLE